MDVHHAQLLPEFDAVYAWTSRDRVIIKRMTAYLAGEKQNVFVEMENRVRFPPNLSDDESLTTTTMT